MLQNLALGMNSIEIIMTVVKFVRLWKQWREYRVLQIVEDFKCFLTFPSPTQNSDCRCVGAENSFKTLFQDNIVINL